MRNFGFCFKAFAAVFLAMATGAWAQSNQIYLLQDSQVAGIGNTLFIDQSAAIGSRVGSAAAPASQIGGGNAATISVSGFGAGVAFSQSGSGNGATVSGDTLAAILLDQQGSGNTGTINVGPFGNSGELVQIGDNNSGTVSVFGIGNRGRLAQLGNNNIYDLEVTGASLVPGYAGTNVEFTQSGSNLAANPTVSALQVFTNSGGTVQITQTRN